MATWTAVCPKCGVSLGDVYTEEDKNKALADHAPVCDPEFGK